MVLTQKNSEKGAFSTDFWSIKGALLIAFEKLAGQLPPLPLFLSVLSNHNAHFS